MSVSAVIVRAAAFHKMQTSRGSMGRWLMGKIAVFTCAAVTCLKKVLADGNLVGVVGVETSWSLVTST